jgi:hypothetical protein
MVSNPNFHLFKIEFQQQFRNAAGILAAFFSQLMAAQSVTSFSATPTTSRTKSTPKATATFPPTSPIGMKYLRRTVPGNPWKSSGIIFIVKQDFLMVTHKAKDLVGKVDSASQGLRGVDGAKAKVEEKDHGGHEECIGVTYIQASHVSRISHE